LWSLFFVKIVGYGIAISVVCKTREEESNVTKTNHPKYKNSSKINDI